MTESEYKELLEKIAEISNKIYQRNLIYGTASWMIIDPDKASSELLNSHEVVEL